jgi:hypothetical protein
MCVSNAPKDVFLVIVMVLSKSIPCTIQCSINAAEQNALFAVQEGKVYAAQHPGIFVYFLC